VEPQCWKYSLFIRGVGIRYIIFSVYNWLPTYRLDRAAPLWSQRRPNCLSTIFLARIFGDSFRAVLTKIRRLVNKLVGGKIETSLKLAVFLNILTN